MTSVAFVSERMLRGFGVDLVIDQVASELVARGHDVTVYASVMQDLGPKAYGLDAIPTRASGVPQRYQAAARPWAEYIDAHEHDIVFVESFPFFSLIPRLKTPAVAVDHGVSSTEGMSARQRAAFRYIRWTQQARYFPKAAGLVTVSEFIRTLLPKRLQERAQVIYNGGDHYPAASAMDREMTRARLGVKEDETMMLYVGRLNPEGQPYKGTADLIHATAEWREREPSIRVVMAGTGDAADVDRIRWAGGIALPGVPDDEMAGLLAAADVYLTASRWEGFNLPIMEAAHQGVPSVALRIGAHPEVVNDGQSGVLADNVTDLFAAAERLATHPDERKRMGAAAREWATRFTWAKSTDGYEQLMSELVVPASPRTFAMASASESGTATAEAGTRMEPTPQAQPLVSTQESDVTAVVLNYGADYPVLHRCVETLVAQTHPVHVLLVDNGSPKNKDAVERVKSDFPDIELLWLDKNYGFAGGMNRGIAAAKGEYVLLVNNDTSWAPDAVAEMHTLLASKGIDVVGIAPKILLENPAGFIDAIGNLVDGFGQAYNMGIGQLDIGQYDRVEETFGACFAATLIRRSAFRKGLVGPMDEMYFMYYEDVDWCFRAGVLGYRFLTCPTSVIYHTHSLTTRQLAYGFKYRLIMRNFVRTILKDFQGRRAYRASAKRTLGLIRNVIRGPYRGASLLAVKDIALGFPGYVLRRRSIQSRRRRPDQELFNYSHGEQGFFDPTGYQPIRALETLQAMYRRLYLLTGNDTHRAIADVARDLTVSRLRFDRDAVLSRLRPLMVDEPEHAKAFVESLSI